MAEYTPPDANVAKEGYRPNTDSLLLELHRLLAIFLSSKGFAELRGDAGNNAHPFDYLQEREEDEITRILLAVAVNARVIDDREQRVFDLFSLDCGVLVESGVENGLSLRDACNKILHAQKFRFDLSETEARQQYLNPVIYLYGERQNGGAWKATLNVIAFVRELSCIRHF